MGPFGPAGLRGKIQVALASLKWLGGQTNSQPRKDDSIRPPLGTINVIFAALARTGSYPSRVMSVARLAVEDANSRPKKARVDIQPVLGFLDEDEI